MRSPSKKQTGRHRLCTDPGAHTLPSRPIYIGSPEHKDYVTGTWRSPRPRADASRCPRLDVDVVEEWLTSAVAAGTFSELWEGGFPRYVWCHVEEAFCEARLTNQGRGEYKGYPIAFGDLPPELRSRWRQ